MQQTRVGGIVGGIQLALDWLKVWSDIIYREFWITVERNNIEPSLLRASILTVDKSGRHSRLWYDHQGWHENPLRPGAYLLLAPTL